jgi:hypothetical protein
VPELNFVIENAQPVPYSATPLIALTLRIDNRDAAEQIHGILLQSQIRIEPARRRYSLPEQAGMLDLFGEPERWSQTLRSTLWTHVSTNVRAFTGSTTIDLPVPCSFDFNIAATKYFHALEAGEVPLALLFSGTVFYQHPERGVQVAQIPWEKEARYRLPVPVWKQAVDQHYPNTAWLALRRDIFDRLHEYKMRHSIPTWEQAFEQLLAQVGQEVCS